MNTEDIDKKIHSVWIGILKRTKYNHGTKEKYKRYNGCSISEEFSVFENFKKWYKNQPGFLLDFEVDKDLLVKGNRVYSSETCLLLPKFLNASLSLSQAARSNLPVGVSIRDKGGPNIYRARCRYCENGIRKRKDIGCFITPEEAFAAYKKFKELYIKSQAEKYKHLISDKAYQALLNYTVEITD